EDRPGLGRLERRELLERGRCTVVVDLDVGEQCGVGAAGADRREVVLCELDGLVHLLSGLGQCLFNHGSLFPSLQALGSFYGSSLKNAAPYPQPSVLTCADRESAVEAAAMGGAVSAPSGPRGSPAGRTSPPRVARESVDDGADLVSGDGLLQIALPLHAEDMHRQSVVHAQRERGGVDDLESALQCFLVSDLGQLLRVRVDL